MDFMVFTYISAFAYGICVGSFLNVVIYRLPLEINMVKGRSFCPSCEHSLGVFDLFPLFSYLFLGAKCRYCKTKISPQYFIVELITGIIYMLVVYVFGISWDSLFYIVLFSLLIPLVRIDQLHSYIPNKLVLLIFVCSLLLGFSHGRSVINIMVSGLVFAFPYIVVSLLFVLLKKKPFGMGDIKIAIALGIGFELSLINLYIYLTLIILSVKIFVSLYVNKTDVNEPFPFSMYIGTVYLLTVLLYRFV